MTNCPNCGHPFHGGRCEYCGTEKQKEMKSELIMTRSKIVARIYENNDCIVEYYPEDEEGEQDAD